jgi:hypothetical protein
VGRRAGDKSAGTGQLRQDNRDIIAAEDSRVRKARTGKRRQGGQNITEWTGQLGQDNRDRTYGTSQMGYILLDRKPEYFSKYRPAGTGKP